MNFKKLSLLVEKSNLGKARIANRCGISRTTLDNVLSGADAKISTIEKIAEVLDVPITEFYTEENFVESTQKKRRGCGGAILEAVESLSDTPSRKELQEEVVRLREQVVTLQRQLSINHHYIALLEKECGTSTEKGDSATA